MRKEGNYMSGEPSKRKPTKKNQKANYKSLSNNEISLKNEVCHKGSIYTSLDSQTKMKVKENIGANKDKANFLYFPNEELTLNTDSNTEDGNLLLKNPIPIKEIKNKLGSKKNTVDERSLDSRKSDKKMEVINPRTNVFNINRKIKIEDCVDELKESFHSGKSNNEIEIGHSIDNNKKSVEREVGKDEDSSRQKSGLWIPKINEAEIESDNSNTRRPSESEMKRRNSKTRNFLGLFKPVSSKISPEREVNGPGVNQGESAQKTIFRNAGETYSFGVLSKISQAIRRFKGFIRYKKLESLQPYQLSIINDWCWYGARKKEDDMLESKTIHIPFHRKLMLRSKSMFKLLLKKNTCLSVCIDLLSGLGENIKVINPKSRLKMTWDLITMMIIFWNFLNISISLCFGEAIENVFLLGKFENAHKMYYFFILISFVGIVIDNLLTLNTSYYEMGALVHNRKQIFRNYLRKNLLIDLIAEVPIFVQLINYESNASSFSQKYLNCLFFLKYYNLKNAFKVLDEFLALDDKYEASFHLFKLFLKIFFVAHILACLWHMAAYFKSDPEAKTWISYKCLDKEGDWTERYIYAIYFALTTMSTVGYGDIMPQSQAEVSIAMLSMLVGSGMFGYALNNIGELLKRMNHKEDQLKKEIRSLDRFMKSKKIDYELQSRARKYLEFVWNEEKQDLQNEEEILEKLSQSLREEVFLQSHGKILKQHPIMFKNFSEKTMRQLIHLIRPVRYSPEELIIEEGEQSLDGFLYMITQGEIKLSLAPQRRDEEKCKVKVLKAGNSFGEISFFTDLPHDFTVTSLHYSTVYRLKKSDFLSVIRENSEDWESFCMIRDKYLLYEDMVEFHTKCWSCSDNHPFKKCPALRYNPTRYKIIVDHQKKIQKMKLQRKKLAHPRRDFHFNALRGKAVVNNKSLHFSSPEENSKNNVEGAIEPIIEILRLDSDPKISLELKMESFKKDSFINFSKITYKRTMDDIPLISSDLKIMKPPEAKFKRRNSAGKPTNKQESSSKNHNKSSAVVGAEPPEKEKLELNPIITNFNQNVEPKPDPSQNDSFLHDNSNELFMMNFDQTKNLTKYFVYNNCLTVLFWINHKQRRKNPIAQNRRLKKAASIMVASKRLDRGSPLNMKTGQKLYFQSE